MTPNTPPNVLFILIDDMGWRDLSCYGSTFYESPNIDRLFAEGMHFTDAYAACPVCSPTRASIMTGRYPARVGVTNYIDWQKKRHPLRGRVIDAPYIDHLPRSERSLAAALKDGGYAAWHVGKWHLGYADSYPEKHGFDVNIGGCEWGMPIHGHFSPWGLPNLPDENVPENTYLDDYLTDRAVDLLRNRDPGQPFYLNLSYYAVHAPVDAKEEDIQYFREKASRLGLDKAENVFREGDFHPYERSRDKRVVHRCIQSNPAFAAMVLNLDRNIGRVLEALSETGAADDTMIVFTSDNGGLSTSGKAPPTCNAPLAFGKGWVEEGGVREPLIVRWPGVVSAGSVCREPVTSPDFYPTILEACGRPLEPAQHVDGKSFMPALRGEPFERGPIFWHYPHYSNCGGHPGCSVRRGAYKLIEFFEDGHLELYDLCNDVGETKNLAGERPAIRDELLALLHEWQDDVGAVQMAPNPDWKAYEEGVDPRV